MADLLRNHSLARIQGQQQQMGQQFGLGPQMGAQQPSFHDQATQQSIPSNFPNTAMANPSQIQQLNSRNAMMQAFQANNQGHMSRQLELMGLTQNQQSQSGYSARMVQQQQQQANMNNQSGQSQSSQPDLFSSPSMPAADGMHSSPSHSSSHTPGPMGNQQASSVQQNGQGLPAGRRHMNFQELRERAQQIQALITQQEQTAIQLSNQRAGVSDADFILKMRALTSDIKNRKELLSRVISAMSASAPNLNGPSPGNVGNMYEVSYSHRFLWLMPQQASYKWIFFVTSTSVKFYPKRTKSVFVDATGWPFPTTREPSNGWTGYASWPGPIS
jgi:hypothetical protein